MEETNGRWHLDRRVSVGHIVTTVVVIVSFVSWMLKMEARIIVNETRIGTHIESVQRLENTVDNQYQEIIRRLERLDDTISNHAIATTVEKNQQ